MKRLLIIGVTLAATGCGHLYEIHDATNQPVKGIPFYSQMGVCTQQTIYVETIYDLTLQTPGADKIPPVVLAQQTIAASAYHSKAMQQLRDSVTKPEPKPQAIKDAFFAIPAYDPQAAFEGVLAANVVRPSVAVNYADVKYINIKRPWAGTASATTKLNVDGSLSEGTASVEDKTIETIASALGSKELITAAAGAAGEAAHAFGLPAVPAIQLVVTPKPFRHTLTKTSKMETPTCNVVTEIPRDSKDANVEVTPIEEGGKGDEKEDAIAVSGKIVLPKKPGGGS
jgi:hypothetical protein